MIAVFLKVEDKIQVMCGGESYIWDLTKIIPLASNCIPNTLDGSQQ
jgi:hypothetical protein